MCMNCSGACSPGRVQEVKDLPDHEHHLEMTGIRMYEVWTCHGCGVTRLVPLLDGWREK